jgi:hypothetical protein
MLDTPKLLSGWPLVNTMTLSSHRPRMFGSLQSVPSARYWQAR